MTHHPDLKPPPRYSAPLRRRLSSQEQLQDRQIPRASPQMVTSAGGKVAAGLKHNRHRGERIEKWLRLRCGVTCGRRRDVSGGRRRSGIAPGPASSPGLRRGGACTNVDQSPVFNTCLQKDCGSDGVGRGGVGWGEMGWVGWVRSTM
jgi:hypothetical protein